MELPIRSTLSNLVLPNTKCDIGFILPSAKFIKYQTVIRNALISSPSIDINSLWAQRSFGCDSRFDQFQNTRQVLNAIQKFNVIRISHELNLKGLLYFPSLLVLVKRPVVYVQLCNNTCLKTF